jgi:hypothetical protein
MKVAKTLLAFLTVSLLVVAFVPAAGAKVLNRTTIVSFNQPIEVPGQVLPAGKYLMEIFETFSYRHIVRIYSPDRDKIFATILAIPNYRLTPTETTVMTFAERPADSPQALKAWFYPGNQYGEEFVYPKARAVELAQVTHETIPTMEKEPATVEEFKTEPLEAVTPENKEVTIAEAFPMQPPAVQAAAPEPATLPKTASHVPLIGLSGVMLVGIAFALRRLAS